MDELKYLLEDIEKLRSYLYKLIEQQEFNLLDEQVIIASQVLNAAITKYNQILDKKIRDNNF